MSDVLFEVREGIGWARLNRPDRLNAMTNELIDGLTDAVAEVELRTDIVALILIGEGRGFCSGADTRILFGGGTSSETPGRLIHRRVQEVTSRIFRLDVPTIAAVNGPAAGAGFELSLACDIRVASTGAFFQHAALKNGLVAGDGSAFFLPRMIGLARSLDLLLTERRVLADEARQIGLIRDVVETERLEEHVQALAIAISKNPSAVAMTKEAVRLGLGVGDPEPVFAYLRMAVEQGRRNVEAGE